MHSTMSAGGSPPLNATPRRFVGPSMARWRAMIGIAGAGPVGLALAIGLARHGVSSVVLEESDALSEHSKAVGVLPRTLETFATWGILDPFVEQGYYLRQIRPWSVKRNAPLLTIDLSPLDPVTVAPGVLILPQNRTERLLYEAARATGRVDVRLGHRVAEFVDDAEGVTVTAQTTAGERVSVRVDYLVGCDGPRSTVRSVLGWPLEGKTYPARMLLADVRVGEPRNALPWPRALAADRYVGGAVRIESDLWRLIATVDKRMSDEEAVAPPYVSPLVDAFLGPGPFELVWASTFHIHCRTSPHFRRGRVFLAGDAAHINSPAGGQGMNSGIQDAHNLAWKLARAVAGGPAESLLASYEAERRPVIVGNVDRFTDLLTRGILLAPAPLRLGVLGAARAALKLPPLSARMLPRAGMLDTQYPDSTLPPAAASPVATTATA